MAFFAVPLMFLMAVGIPLFRHGNKTLSGWATMLIMLLLGLILAATTIALIQRDKMTTAMAGGVSGMIFAFWLLGLVLITSIRLFGQYVQPFSHSRSLLLLLVISFYVLWFSGKDYNVLLVFLLGATAMIVWIMNGKNRVLSAELETYQKMHYETAFIVTTLIFAVTVNLAISMAKKTNVDSKTVYLFNIIIFGLAWAVLVSIATVALLQMWKAPGSESGLGTDATPKNIGSGYPK
jgi:hypothetical protein